ncbi:MAG: hypothetical protein L6420_09965 [Elusimicrobia bacterium]|nr:hypothetical protein [Elusimicrobiota bacterium]
MISKNNKKETITGKYIYDKKLGKVIKVSDKITGLKKRKNNNCPAGNNSCGGCCGL